MARNKKSQQEVHRPGPLKQTNKKHKTGRHRSKGVLDAEGRGRTSSIGSITKRHRQAVGRAERRKQAMAIRGKKIQVTIDKKKQIGGARGAPISIALIPLSSCSNPKNTLAHIVGKTKDEAKFIGQPNETTVYLKLNNGKNVTLVVPPAKDIWALLDTMKTTDITLFHVPILEPLTEESVTLLRTAREQGLVTPQICTTTPFSRAEEKAFLKGLNKQFVNVPKVFPMQSASQILNALRIITSGKLVIPNHWCQRSCMQIEETRVIHFSANDISSFFPEIGPEFISSPTILQVTGVVRKQNLNPQRLVHITGIGDFRILRVDVNPIEGCNDSKPLSPFQVPPLPSVPPRYLYDPKAVLPEDLETVTESQQGSDEEDMMSDDEAATDAAIDCLFNSKQPPDGRSDATTVEEQRKATKGFLKLQEKSYQTDWLDDSDTASSEDDDGSEQGDMECDTASQQDSQADIDEDEGWEDDQEQLEVARAARTEAEFPDWVDTPMDRPARDRFQRYRGLQSFRKTPWDPYENLPKEYANIFQFADFKRSYKRAISEPQDGAGFIPVGQRISLMLVPEAGAENMPINTVNSAKPVCMSSHLRHEGKMSVLNLLINVTDAIKNKEELIFQVGHRRFQAKPILSECTPGNKHKMLRFAQPNTSCVATVIAPVVFPTASVLVFRVIRNNTLVPVGGGSVLSIDPTRVVVKRVLLSGCPFRPHGRKAVVRFMFFSREDIEWFKPVELRTRYGRRGHITEPLGTHGRMKCIFDGPIKSQDTVLMPLYKRVFPKCNYEPYVGPFQIFEHVDIRPSVLGAL